MPTTEPHFESIDRSRHVVGLDGLRGIAVAAVVGYHVRPEWFPGGFLGVDLFFVLSGYLITGLLLREHDRFGRIDFGRFVVRRMRRLMPALIMVVLATLGYAWIDGLPGQLDEVRRHGIAALAYVANWVFIADGSSYFADIAGPSMLKHVWSLAIEEQFYVLWPATLLVMARWRGRNAVAAGAAVLTVASVVWMAVQFDPTDPSRVYFGTDTRIFEPLLGAVVAVFVPLDRLAGRGVVVARRAGFAGGAALTAWLAVVFVIDDAWTGFYRGGALVLALVGAVMVVAATAAGGPYDRLLSFRPLVTLGEISYGLYLWHWPILIGFRQQGLRGPTADIAVVAAAVIVALLSHRLVEMPVRHSRLGSRSMIGALAASALIVGVVSAASAAPTGGVTVEEALESAIESPPATTTSTKPPVEAETVVEPDVIDEPLTVMLIGDSTAWTLGGGEAGFSTQHGPYVSPFDPSEVNLVNMGRKGYRLIPGSTTDAGGVRPRPPDDLESEAWWRSSIVELQPDVVVALFGFNELQSREIDGELVEFGSPEFDQLIIDSAAGILGDLGEVSPVVVLTSPLLRVEAIPSTALFDFADQYANERVGHFNEVLSDMADTDAAVSVIDFGAWLCATGDSAAPPDDVTCRLDSDGDPIRYDGIHFSPAGGRSVAQWLTPQLKQAAPTS